ncbi:MAG: hypothetical protein RIS48_2136, partial [Pseudomonadota bacterium]
RRQQCEAAARHYGVAALRDLDLERLERDRAGLDALSWRASHASMRDDFEITVPAIDRLVALLQAVVGQQGGARMTGGGFGGCVVALMPEALVGPAQAALAQHYRAPSGETATVYLCRPGAGAGLLDSAALAPLR